MSKCLWPAASLQPDPETDWMFTGDPGKGGLVSRTGVMPVPRGKMFAEGLPASTTWSFVRGHPGDFDNWERLVPTAGA
ncbi:MAG: hypothetical protein IPO50_09555 [Sphingomonadales bacterium]|nr:hypothetical protein [Sphingomonadales bacterium]